MSSNPCMTWLQTENHKLASLSLLAACWERFSERQKITEEEEENRVRLCVLSDERRHPHATLLQDQRWRYQEGNRTSTSIWV